MDSPRAATFGGDRTARLRAQAALDQTRLHPALARALDASAGAAAPAPADPAASVAARTLAACVPADRVRKWAEHCARSLAAFEADGERLATVCADVAARVEARGGLEAAAQRAARLDGLEADRACCAALASRQRGLVEALGYDERDASRLVAEHGAPDLGAYGGPRGKRRSRARRGVAATGAWS